jgi:hypothetical protein
MDDQQKLWVDTTFTTEGIWDGVNNEIKDKIRRVLPLCFETGIKWYEDIWGYDKLPQKVKHHLDIRMEMNKDIKIKN